MSISSIFVTEVCLSVPPWKPGIGQHLNASHPRSSVWQNQNVTIFSGLIPKLRASCQLVLNKPRDWCMPFLQIETIHSSAYSQPATIICQKNNFRASIVSEMGLQPTSHIWENHPGGGKAIFTGTFVGL